MDNEGGGGAAMDGDHEMLVQTVRRFVREKVQPLEVETENAGVIPPDRLAEVRAEALALNLYAMNMPAEVGGGGLSTYEMCLVEEQFGQTSDALIRRIFGQVYPMLMACTPAQREAYLRPTIRGERICAMAITEPNAGSDAAGITTTARRVDGGWAISGVKHFISDGDIADYTIVMALTDPEKRARGGITLFLVDGGAPGFRVGGHQEMMGHRGYGHAELVFEDCRVPEDAVLGEVGQGFRLIMESVADVRLCHIGARCMGMAQRVLDMMREHAANRRQFGQPIGDFQMVQKMLADAAMEIYATRCMVLDCARDVDAGRNTRQKVSMIKVYASEMLCRVADMGIQVFGGYGYSKDLPLERIYRDARVTRIYDGTSEVHRMVIARSLLKDGLAI